jgi:hypothetical protein
MKTYVARLNIQHFRRQIAAEADPKKLEIIRRLLAEEEAKLNRLLDEAPPPLRRAAPNWWCLFS